MTACISDSAVEAMRNVIFLPGEIKVGYRWKAFSHWRRKTFIGKSITSFGSIKIGQKTNQQASENITGHLLILNASLSSPSTPSSPSSLSSPSSPSSPSSRAGRYVRTRKTSQSKELNANPPVQGIVETIKGPIAESLIDPLLRPLDEHPAGSISKEVRSMNAYWSMGHRQSKLRDHRRHGFVKMLFHNIVYYLSSLTIKIQFKAAPKRIEPQKRA